MDNKYKVYPFESSEGNHINPSKWLHIPENKYTLNVVIESGSVNPLIYNVFFEEHRDIKRSVSGVMIHQNFEQVMTLLIQELTGAVEDKLNGQ